MRLVLLFPALMIMVLLAVIFTVTAGKVMNSVQNPQPITGLAVAKQVDDVGSFSADPRYYQDFKQASPSPSPSA
ncbi:MAG: hypothetical protein V1811_00420 [Candidatus Micrarchaeota archaeon]